QGGSPVSVAAGAVLQGGGTVGAITAAAGAAVSPGGTAPAILHDTGGATFASGATYSVILNGTNAGTTYNQLEVAGQITLGNATLNGSLGFSPTANEQFTILNNTSALPVSGTFNGLAEGATVTIGGQPFRISYTGGDGNDVVLTHLVASTTGLNTSTT